MEYEWDHLEIDYPTEFLEAVAEMEKNYTCNCFSNVRGAIKAKAILREDNSTALLRQDPLNDRAEHFYHFYRKSFPFSNFYLAKFVIDNVK